MRSKITVVGRRDAIVRELSLGDYATVVDADELPGSDVVVIAGEADVAAEAQRAARRASGAVVVVVDGDVRSAVESTMFPRGRVISVPAERVREVVEAVLFDRRVKLTVTIVGLDDEIATVPAIVGTGGVREIG